MSFLMNHDGNTLDGYSNKITNRIKEMLSENIVEANQPYMEEKDSNADSIMSKIVSSLGKTTSEVNQMIPLLARTSDADAKKQADAKALAEAKKQASATQPSITIPTGTPASATLSPIVGPTTVVTTPPTSGNSTLGSSASLALGISPAKAPKVGSGIIEDSYEAKKQEIVALEAKRYPNQREINKLKEEYNANLNGQGTMKALKDLVDAKAIDKRTKKIESLSIKINEKEVEKADLEIEIKKMEEELDNMPSTSSKISALPKSTINDPYDYKIESKKNLTNEEYELQKKYNTLTTQYNEDLETIQDLIDDIDAIEDEINKNYSGIESFVPTTYDEAIKYEEDLPKYNELIKQHEKYKSQHERLTQQLNALYNNIEDLTKEISDYDVDQQAKNTPEGLRIQEKMQYDNAITQAEFDSTPIIYGKTRFASDNNFVLYNTKVDTIVTNLKNIDQYFLQLFRNNIGYIEPENINKYKDEWKTFNKSLTTLINIIRSRGVDLFDITLNSGNRAGAMEFLKEMHEILREYVEKLEDNTSKLLDSYNYRSDKVHKKQNNASNKIASNKQQSSILYDEE
jgi:hypothetical protein